MVFLGIGSDDLSRTTVRFTYLEYQLMMLCLAGTMCLSLVAIELIMKRYQVLPLLFPGMFSIRGRRLYFFDNDVDDVGMAKKLRGEAKQLMRIVLFVVLSYLWQHCVLATHQSFGKEFPREQCDRDMDCFSSELHVATFFTRQYEPVDCTSTRQMFESRVAVSCVAFIQPTASNWLMHLAIAHSITQLNFKCFEVGVWVTGSSMWARRIACAITIVTFCFTVSLFFIGSLTNFTSSWLSVVTSFWIPIFVLTTCQTGKILQQIREREEQKVQNSIEDHLNQALDDFCPGSPNEASTEVASFVPSRRSPARTYLSSIPGHGSLLKVSSTISNIFQEVALRPSARTQKDSQTTGAAREQSMESGGGEGQQPEQTTV
jgi:hypothetical protein